MRTFSWCSSSRRHEPSSFREKTAIWRTGRRGHRELRDEGPVRPDPASGRLAGPEQGELQVFEVDRQHAGRAERLRYADERPVKRVRIRQVVEDVADGHDRVGGRQRIVGQGQSADLGGARRVPGQVEHRRRGVGRDDPMTRLDEVAGEKAAPAPELEHQPVALTNRGQQLKDARRACIGVEAESEMVRTGEIPPVVRSAAWPHGVATIPRPCSRRRPSRTASAW